MAKMLKIMSYILKMDTSVLFMNNKTQNYTQIMIVKIKL